MLIVGSANFEDFGYPEVLTIVGKDCCFGGVGRRRGRCRTVSIDIDDGIEGEFLLTNCECEKQVSDVFQSS